MQANGNVLSFGPVHEFRPGEVVQVTLGATGGSVVLAAPQVYQFTVAATGGTGDFSTSISIPYAPPTTSTTVRVGDVNADGSPDVFVLNNSYPYGVDWHQNNGVAGFGPGQHIATSAPGKGLALADIDGDGDLDLLAPTYNREVVVWLNDGQGNWSRGTNCAINVIPETLAVADVDGDGDLDVLIGAGNTVIIRLNDGQGTFTGSGSVAMSSGGANLVAADIDNDGDLDLVSCKYTMATAINNGQGVFSPGASIAVAGWAAGLVVADLNSDGRLDVATSYENGSAIGVRFNNGNGTFGNGLEVPIEGNSLALAAADVDGDGDLDLLAAISGSNQVSIRLNNGTGIFSAGSAALSNSVVGQRPCSIAAADVDGDGDMDIVTAHESVTETRVLLNNGRGAPLARIASQALPALALYPNPAHGTATIELAGRAATLTLTDALGRVVQRQALPAGTATAAVPLAGLVPGLYHVLVQAQCLRLSQKLVVD